MQTTRPRISWKVYNGSGAIFKNIRSSAKDLDCGVYSELKRHNVSHYIYYLAADIHIVLKTSYQILIKGLKKGCKC